MAWFVLRVYFVLTIPVSILFILNSAKMHPSYRMNVVRKLALGVRMFWNTVRIKTGTSYKTHLAMALKLLEAAPDVPGVVVECGTWKGGSAANLSLICRIVGRKLKVYDSFEGLPPGVEGDREAPHYEAGDYCGSLDEVKKNIQRFGAIEVCEFRKGWFSATLTHLEEDVLLAFLDVDYEESLEMCVRCIWPRLVAKGFIFIDECVAVDYCALFYSERYWRERFDRTPPGMIGAGVGLPLGEFYIGPWDERQHHPLQHSNAGSYTRKDFSGHWTFYPHPV